MRMNAPKKDVIEEEGYLDDYLMEDASEEDALEEDSTKYEDTLERTP